MNRFSALLIPVIIFALSQVIGCSSESKTLKVNPSTMKFGNVNIGESVDMDLTITNKYDKDVMISDMTLVGSYDFIIYSGAVFPIDLLKGAEHKITIKFTPTSDGLLVSTLSILHDASAKEKLVEISGTGVKVARIDLSDTTFDFDKKLISRTHTHDLDIENVGTSDLEINNLSFTGLGAAVYSISAGGPTPINIMPGTSKTITIAFNPIVIGNYAADLQIYHNAVNENSPIVYPISGEGIDVDPQITLSQTSPWDFGSVASTMPATQICEIENTGIDPLTVTSATLATGTAFTIASLKDSNGNVINFPRIVAVGAKIMLAIKFEPTATTTFNDTLTIVHDGTNEVSPLDISITGEGRLIIEKTFNYTGAPEQWTVPAGVTSIDVEAYGAEAGLSTGSAGTPGKGGKLTAKLTVSPGDILNIYVGGKGGNGSPGVGGTAGWNGGAPGESYSGGRGGGGGGGATDIRKNGTDLTDRIFTVGSGGGCGHNGSGESGGNGGGLIGQKGSNNYGGGGGTQTAGGAGGDAGSGRIGDPGTLGKGGRGWAGSTAGGGGAGHYGGGGGSYEAGGGGSSFTETTATNVVHTQGVRSNAGELKITY